MTELPQTTPSGRRMSPKQIRARARRRKKMDAEDLAAAQQLGMYKPVEEWDMEELARGRPKSSDGTFRGSPPAWITRELHELAMDRFKLLLRQDMAVMTSPALQTLTDILENDDTDSRGRPVVPASVKVDVAKFLLEHQIGKPVQPTTTDISVKLQALLAQVVVSPNARNDELVEGWQGSRALGMGKVIEHDGDEE